MTRSPVQPELSLPSTRHGWAFALFCLLWVALAVYTYGFLAPRLGMSDDAAILYLYSENLADTGVISFYAGGPPVEGATDFLWMVALAGLYRLGLDTHLAAVLLSAAAHVGTAWLVMRLAGGRDRRVFLGAALGLFLVPAFGAALLGFSVFVFGFLVLACALCFVERRTAALAATALLTCLVRPDGVVFTVPLLGAAWFLEREQRARVAKHALFLFALPFATYFAWRAWTFGHLFPLPYYVKSGAGGLRARLERLAQLSVLKSLLPILPATLWTVWELRRRPRGARAPMLALLLALLLVPLFFYSSFQLTQNIGLRFEYPLLLAGLVLPLVPIGGEARGARGVALAGLGLLLLLPMTLRQAGAILLMPLQSLPGIARDIAALPCGRTMAVTEAGWLPYYSRWTCVDLWGLNTPACARVAVPVAYLERQAPDLLVVNSPPLLYRRMLRGEEVPSEASEHTWANMIANTFLFAHRNGYELLMVPSERALGRGPEVTALTRFVRRLVPQIDFSEHCEMVFLAPNSACRDELRRILVAHDGVTLEEFMGRRRAQQQGR